MATPVLPGGQLDRSPFELVLDEAFSCSELDGGRWLAHYLPHWSTPDRSAARYALDGSSLQLRVEHDQPPWRPEDGELRVSNLQTGVFAGPVGSSTGQHRHRPDLVVRTAQTTRRLWTPTAGLVELTVEASPDPTCMLGLWLVGFEESSPTESGEICIAELFGDAITPERSSVRLGVKAHHDPALTTDMVDLELALDATRPHTYAASWDAERVHFFVDDRLVRTVEQGIGYPQQLMVDLFEFPDRAERDPADYPKTARVHQIRGYAWRPVPEQRA